MRKMEGRGNYYSFLIIVFLTGMCASFSSQIDRRYMISSRGQPFKISRQSIS